MSALDSRAEQLALYCAFGSAAAALVSIAASQILLGVGVAALLVSRRPWRFPPVLLPLLLFMGGTLVSASLSDDPWSGLPQFRKFFVWLILPLVFTTLRPLKWTQRLHAAWFAIGALASAVALAQFARKFEEAERLGQDFYQYYVGERISGFMSHWMTFGGQGLIVLLLVAAFLFFAPNPGRRGWWLALASAGVLLLALLLGFTRSIWLGAAAGFLYLLWFWKRALLVAVPVLAGLIVWLGPAPLRSRVVSVFRPHGQQDSNQHRIVCWRTGLRMIQAHPVVGVGPEQVGPQLLRYLPPDIQPPLPQGWYGHLHSIYVHYAAERGLPTLAALLWLIGKVLWDCWRAVLRLPPGRSGEKYVLHGSVAVILGILVSGVFELNLGDSEILAMFLTVVATAYVAMEGSYAADAAPAKCSIGELPG